MKKNIVISLVVLVFLFISSYWSYLIGFTASQTATFSMHAVLVKEQSECIKKNDVKCTDLTNKLMLEFMKTQAEALRNTKMSGEFDKELNEFIKWHENSELSLQ